MSYIKVNRTWFHPSLGKELSFDEFSGKYQHLLKGHNIRKVWVDLGGKEEKPKTRRKKKDE